MHSKTLRRGKVKRVSRKILIYALLIIVAVICAGPFAWVVSTSFKGNENLYALRFLPQDPTFDNYIGVAEFLDLGRYMLNTVYITVAGILLDIVLASLCAYPLAKFDFYGKGFIVTLLLSTQILPTSANNIVNYLTISKLGIMGTLASVILPGAVGVFSIIFFRQAYMAVPNEMMEAARIDGASELQIWAKIMLPQTRAAVSTVVIFDFTAKWNSFLWPIIVLRPDKYPIAAALNYLNGKFNYNFGYIMAATVISIIPVILVFCLFQKNYLNVVAGSVKG